MSRIPMAYTRWAVAAVLLVNAFLVVAVSGQLTNDVVDCTDWDTAFAQAFVMWALIFAAVFAWVVPRWFLPRLAARHWWWASNPKKRSIFPAVAGALMFALLFIAFPLLASKNYLSPEVGMLALPDVDSRYASCEAVNGSGFLGFAAGKAPLLRTTWALAIVMLAVFGFVIAVSASLTAWRIRSYWRRT